MYVSQMRSRLGDGFRLVLVKWDRHRAKPLSILTLAMAFGALVSLLYREWLGFGAYGSLALSLGLQVSDSYRDSSRIRRLTHGLLAIAFVAMAVHLIA